MAKIVKSRQVNTYLELWRVSYWAMRQAEKESTGSSLGIMASLIFTAFTLEAYLNHIGKSIFKCWNDLERMLSPSAKIKLIAEELNVNKGRSPFRTVKKLFDFRRDIAHGKTITITNEEQLSDANASNFDEYLNKIMEAKWEKYCTLENAINARNDVEEIMVIFHNAVGNEDDVLFGGVWSSVTTIE